MGKADNRRTSKMKRRRAQLKKKMRAKKITEIVRTARKSGKKGVTAQSAVALSKTGAAVRRTVAPK